MKTRRELMKAAVALAAVATIESAARGDEPKVEGDLKTLQGKWSAPAQNGDKVTYTFKGKTLKVEAPTRSYGITVTLDEKAKPEKTMDMKIDEAPEDAKGKTSKAIYKLEGDDAMTFCFSPEGDRPDKYEMVGYEKIVVKLKREKD